MKQTYEGAFSHYLITRFNIRAKSPEIIANQNKDIAINPEWLNHRFDLFERYCFPSVENQTCRAFKWLVFFDDATPKNYQKKIHNYENKYRNFIPIFLNHTKDFNTELSKTIHKLHSPTVDRYIITTRLDNDDAIHENFINQIQENFIPQHNTIIDIRNGYQITKKNTELYEIRDYRPVSNHFISVIEEFAVFKTIFNMIHPAWVNLADNLIVLEKNPLWIEFIHGKNNLCHTRNYLKRRKKINSKAFGFSNKIKDSMFKVCVANTFRIVNRIKLKFCQ